ncbi:MAG: efflux RND transporter periplasmic adaptor subunit [Enterobacterales bacterium]|nr:efflux RND transporter periplasmic adaptor subunit [Enterobacterales bacterium]
MLPKYSHPFYFLSLFTLLSGVNAANQQPLSKISQKTIETTKVQALTLDHRIAIDAKVESVNQTTLTAQTSGQIAAIYFDGGDHVKAGSILLKLKDKNQKAGYQAAEAALKATKTELNDAKRSFERTKSIFAKKLTSQESLDSAKARLNIAKANNEAAQARLNAAEEQLNYTLIEAPYSGIVLERHVNLGEIVSPGTPLFSGTSLSQIKVVAQIPQVDMPLVKHYADAIIELPRVNMVSNIHLSAETPTENIHISGKAISFYAYASANSSTFKVKLKLPEQSFNLYPGMYLKTHFKIGSIKFIAVPSQAIVKRAELRAVYVQDKLGKLHLRQIRVGKTIDQNLTQVISGLDVDEVIILNPLQAIGSLAQHQRGE